MEKTILRILAGTNLSPSLEQTLNEFMPNHVKEFFTEQVDYKTHVQQRINSLYDAFLFLVAAYPPKSMHSYVSMDTASTWITELKNDALALCNDSSTSFVDSRKELKRFTTQLLISIQYMWQTEDAVHYLNDAEQYMLMQHGRSHTATLTPMRFGKSVDYLLQWEQVLPAYYDEWLVELRFIAEKNFPNTPQWFSTLKPEAQNYLCGIKSVSAKNDVGVTLEALITNLAQIEKHTSLWRVENKKLLQHISELIVPASETTLVAMNDFQLFLEQKRMDPSFAAELSMVLELPSWYLFLSEAEHYFLKHVISHAQTLEASVSFLSSRHRSLPAPANFASHQLIRLCADGTSIPLSEKRYRSSHIASRDVLKLPTAVQTRHSDFNLREVLRYARPEQEILFQTLVSPVPEMDKFGLPDLQLDKEAHNAIGRSSLAPRIAINNHPYNKAKYLLFTQADNANSMALIEKTNKYIERLSRDIEASQLQSAKDADESHIAKNNKLVLQRYALVELVTHYNALLNSASGSATLLDVNGRELFLSSLEQLLMLQQEGYCYGSCVSGKDRKAIELMHTDACLIYKERYHAWPKFTDTEKERDKFAIIVADLYLSRHHQVLAGQNAPGAAGIKTPSNYLPSDICKMIERRRKGENILENDDKLATYNEVKAIFPSPMPSFFSYANPPKATLTKVAIVLLTREMGENLCTKLYDALYALINERHLFEENMQGKKMFSNDLLPTGIKEIKTVMHRTKKDINESSMNRIEDIISIVASRPHKQNNRNDATSLVYDQLIALLNPLNATATKEQQLALHVSDIIEQWNTLFEQSKNDNAVRNETMDDKNIQLVRLN